MTILADEKQENADWIKMKRPAPIETYDDSIHEYRRDGIVFPGVTQVMNLLTEGLYDFANESGKIRGSDVHAIIAAWENTPLGSEVKVPEKYALYLEAWIAFKKYHRLGIPFKTEMKLFSNRRYAGRLDLLYLDCEKYGNVLLDIKTYDAEELLAGIQTAAYLNLIRENRPGDLDWLKVKRFMVILKPNGKYRLKRLFNYDRDIAYFLNCVAVTNIKKLIGGKS